MGTDCFEFHLRHVVDQQQRHRDGGDVVGAAHLQDVPQAHDGRVAGRDVARAQVVVHAQVEDHVHLGQVGVARDVELASRERNKMQTIFKKKLKEV